MLNDAYDSLSVFDSALHELKTLPAYKVNKVRAHAGAEARRLLALAETDPGSYELAAEQEAIHRAAVEILRIKADTHFLSTAA